MTDFSFDGHSGHNITTVVVGSVSGAEEIWRGMAEGWLNASVWVSSSILNATSNQVPWLPGTVLDLLVINEETQLWRITISLDSTNQNTENGINSHAEQIVIIETKGSLNQPQNNLDFEGIYHRSDSSHFLEYNDLSRLPYVNQPEILAILHSRYSHEQPFIFIGPILLAMNPFHDISLYDETTIHKYISYGELRNLSNLPPHIYKIADTAYRHMLLDLFDPLKRENQTIVITGDSGAGKTECSKSLLHYLCLLSQEAPSWSGDLPSPSLSAAAAVENTIEKLVRSTDAITESLGNAKTLQNDNSSRFGKYIELSYSPAGRIQGVSLRTYLLECTRVTHHSLLERNFHIFYQLHAGLSETERTSLGFESIDHFHYLNQGSPLSASSTDASSDWKQKDLENFHALISSFDLFHISPETRQELFKVFIGILHIGNIEFVPKRSHGSSGGDRGQANGEGSGNEESCEISSLQQIQFHLHKACELMGYAPETLQETLCITRTTIKGKEILTNNSVVSALEVRDRLSKTLYYSLFKWILSEINFVLSEEGDREGEGEDQTQSSISSWIGILDIFGFENIQQNSLEQLCKSVVIAILLPTSPLCVSLPV
jgi:myosin V